MTPHNKSKKNLKIVANIHELELEKKIYKKRYDLSRLQLSIPKIEQSICFQTSCMPFDFMHASDRVSAVVEFQNGDGVITIARLGLILPTNLL